LAATPLDTIFQLFYRVGGAGELESKRRVLAAKPLGGEKGPAAGRGTTPARIAVIVALAAAVIVLAVVFFTGSSGHKYTLVFQNAGQLVPDNQVLIGGSPAGTVSSIGLTDDNLAEINIELDQELHEGTTAAIRATSLSGVANHYVAISPGPNSNPSLDDGAELGLASTSTPIDIDQFFNTFPPRVQKGLSNFIKGNASIYSGQGKTGNEAYKYFGTALNRAGAFARELNADQRLLSRFIVSTSQLTTAVAGRGEQLSSAIGNANTAFNAIADETAAFDATLRRLPPVMRQSNTTFVNLRAALDDLEPLVNTAKPATRDLAPFLRELRPVFQKLVPFTRNLKLIVSRPGKGNDAADLLGTLPQVQNLTQNAFPHSEQAIEDFQPNLNFIRAYTPDFFNALGKLGQVAGYYDGNGHYVRAATAGQNLFRYNPSSSELEPISKGEQFGPFGSTETRTRCPGGATQPAADGSNPWVGGDSVDPSECDPGDVPPGP
jgi:phospholipid/cholesterol/gamma-HCH transport system substrate-binding protein